MGRNPVAPNTQNQKETEKSNIVRKHLGLALGSPIFPSGCEGKLGAVLESLQGLRDLT